MSPIIGAFGVRAGSGLLCFAYRAARMRWIGFFEELELPEANYNLDVDSGTHAEQSGKIMELSNF